jgi:hypothetical protein
MPGGTWSRVLDEFNAELPNPGPPAPWARILTRKVQAAVAASTRPLIIYGSACTATGKQLSSAQLQIDHSDKIGFHEMLEHLTPPNVDIIIHSPGGFAEAAETIIEEIRRKFTNVRFIVPAYAKSAATMMTMAADEILIDEDAELGPIDPQMLTANGVASAEAIKEQFKKASKEILADPKKLSTWIPILQPMGPALLVQCDNAIALSKQLVREWLRKYMFRGTTGGAEEARKVANYLGRHSNFRSHGRRVKLDQLSKFKKLSAKNLRADPALYGPMWEVYCVMDIIFANTPIYKLFFNSNGDAFARQVAQAPVLMLGGVPPGTLPIGVPRPPGTP